MNTIDSFLACLLDAFFIKFIFHTLVMTFLFFAFLFILLSRNQLLIFYFAILV